MTLIIFCHCLNWPLIILLTGIMLFAYWLNYIMGGPLSDDPKHVDMKAILFAFPNWLATRRLKRAKVLQELRADAMSELAMTSDPRTRQGLLNDKRLDIYLEGRKMFTWERSLLCPICLHWWLTIVVGAVLIFFDAFNARADFFLAGFIYLVNHLLIRKIS